MWFLFLSLLCISINFSSNFALPTRHNRTTRETNVISTCYNFVGIVRCEDGSATLPTATIQLWEKDFLTPDDLLHTEILKPTSDPKTAHFAWNGCYNDGSFLGVPYPKIEIYYQFIDVCYPGDEYFSEIVETKRHRKMNLYILQKNDAKVNLLHLD